jgi:hypothetical protein
MTTAMVGGRDFGLGMEGRHASPPAGEQSSCERTGPPMDGQARYFHRRKAGQRTKANLNCGDDRGSNRWTNEDVIPRAGQASQTHELTHPVYSRFIKISK